MTNPPDYPQPCNPLPELRSLRLQWLLAALLLFTAGPMASAEEAPSTEGAAIGVESSKASDNIIANRLTAIYDEIAPLSKVTAQVAQGVVVLQGTTANEADAARAVELARRVDGVVTVEDDIERTLALDNNVRPLLQGVVDKFNNWLRALPLLAVALLFGALIAWAGHRLALWQSFWRRITPNQFLAELLAQSIRVAAILVGIVAALEVMGARTLIGTVLGGAGVLGIAIGFAVRDTLENYISSIMLSLRQPFRAQEHVRINDLEGIVVKLTSRATVLMTMEGNHLRIPNADVFKATILNFSRNPERRLEFELGVDAADDPLAAIDCGLSAIRELPFVLRDPAASAIIQTVGDSNIVLSFRAWIDQNQTDFFKARSQCIRVAMSVLEDQGFTMPEPIYRLRIDEVPALLTAAEQQAEKPADATPAVEPPPRKERAQNDAIGDVSPETHIQEKVAQERIEGGDEDLLSDQSPTE